MISYQDILTARDLLQLPERASMQEIRQRYHTLLTRWHPDTCREDTTRCHEMTQQLNAAYAIIRTYCEQYRFSFSRAEIEQYMSPEDWWRDKFGNDPLWGGGNSR